MVHTAATPVRVCRRLRGTVRKHAGEPKVSSPTSSDSPVWLLGNDVRPAGGRVRRPILGALLRNVPHERIRQNSSELGGKRRVRDLPQYHSQGKPTLLAASILKHPPALFFRFPDLLHVGETAGTLANRRDDAMRIGVFGWLLVRVFHDGRNRLVRQRDRSLVWGSTLGGSSVCTRRPAGGVPSLLDVDSLCHGVVYPLCEA